MALDIGLVGRQESIRCLDGVIASARAGSGAALLLRGDPGVGKSALLAAAERRAGGFRVLRSAGSEFEAELPFAGLHQLCAPELDRLAALPPVPRRALEAAFGLADVIPDLFAIGVGVLELLGAAGRERPLLCVVDDAHWLDDASARVLSFVARRIGSESIAVLLAARMSGRTAALDTLPVVEVHGLDDADARALLAAGAPGSLDDRVRERILAEARGNPLALLELPRNGVMAGGFAVPDEYPVTAAIERGFRARLLALPAAHRLLLTIASADPTGDTGLLWSAVDSAGLDPSVAADTGGLADFDVRVRFCHPLARSVVYRAADPEQRRAAHGWLADATDEITDPDRRAWHRALACAGPDDEVAAELEVVAGRAETRGGVAAAAAFLARAAALTRDPDRRVDRILTAVRARLAAGAVAAAADLLATVDEGRLDVARRARVDQLHGRLAFARDADGAGPAFMLRAAHRLAAADPRRSRAYFLDALEMALEVGRATGVMDMVLEAARAAPPAPPPSGASDALLDAMLSLSAGDHRTATALLRPMLSEGAAEMWTERPALGVMLAAELWDIDAHARLTAQLLRVGRESGSLPLLRLGLTQVATAAVHRGDLDAAAAAIAEEEAVADAFGAAPHLYPRLHLAALRGRRAELAALADAVRAAARQRGEEHLLANVHWATAISCNAVGEYAAALDAARRATAHRALFVAGISLAELVEAAVRSGEPAAARIASAELTERAAAAGTAWSLGVAAAARALVSDAEDDYRESLVHLDAAPLLPSRARARLRYGEWLRRQGRRKEAREQLRAAHESLSDIGMAAFARRAAAELRATGESVRSRTKPTYDQLTMQELHIARLVATGATSKEVAAQLFLSPRTVDAHLRNIFRKLGVTSRRQLRTLPDLVPNSDT
ncbi:LuxR family transcriptional regulator [Nocardia sp. CC227C]|uniref:helix-turn-helix transcriptional regulator n=1 Tax=Nocardia sp. CC227C TaxID=3044562 RepID=UPI00278C582F|nr:LuxR family transcriptional regulator [Nocardia sp. CC227C]